MSTLPGVNAYPFYGHPNDLKQARERKLSTLEEKIEQQYLLSLYYSSGRKLSPHSRGYDEATLKNMRDCIHQRVRHLPKMLARNPTTTPENLLPRMSEGLMEEILLASKHQTEGTPSSNDQALTNPAGLSSINLTTPTHEEAMIVEDVTETDEETLPEQPLVGRTDNSCVLESQIDVIDDLRGVEEELRLKINSKKREVIILKGELEFLGVRTDNLIQELPTVNLVQSIKKSTSREVSLDERIDNMRKYIKRREKESDQLSLDIRRLQQKIESTANESTAPELPSQNNSIQVEEAEDPYASWFTEVVPPRSQQSATPAQFEEPAMHPTTIQPIAPEALKMVPRIIRIKRLNKKKRSGKPEVSGLETTQHKRKFQNGLIYESQSKTTKEVLGREKKRLCSRVEE